MDKAFWTFLIGIFIFTGCETNALTDSTPEMQQPVDNVETRTDDEIEGEGDGVWAKENFDLLAVGSLLEDVKDIEELEQVVNSKEGVNNLDLDGDGFTDYVSIEEFEDRSDGERGFTLFSKFGPDEVQEIASLIFLRDRPDRRGSNVYVQGNRQIYGDNFGFRGNWIDKSIAIAGWVFGDRASYYRSPYYNRNLPDYYGRHKVVTTVKYKSRLFKYHKNPAMTKITTPFGKIMIKSRYPGRSYRRAHARMSNPTGDQKIFINAKFGKPGKGGKPGKAGDPKSKSDTGKGKSANPPGKKAVKSKGKGAGKKPKGKPASDPGPKGNKGKPKGLNKGPGGPKGKGGGKGRGKGKG